VTVVLQDPEHVKLAQSDERTIYEVRVHQCPDEISDFFSLQGFI